MRRGSSHDLSTDNDGGYQLSGREFESRLGRKLFPIYDTSHSSGREVTYDTSVVSFTGARKPRSTVLCENRRNCLKQR